MIATIDTTQKAVYVLDNVGSEWIPRPSIILGSIGEYNDVTDTWVEISSPVDANYQLVLMTHPEILTGNLGTAMIAKIYSGKVIIIPKVE